MDSTVIRIICSVLAVMFLGVIVLRRNKSADDGGHQGPDLIEYALMAGFVAVAAGAIMPGVGRSISVIFSRISAAM